MGEYTEGMNSYVKYRLTLTRLVGAFIVVAVFLMAPVAYARPALQVVSSASSLTESLSTARFKVTTNESGTYQLIVTDRYGRRVNLYQRSIVANKTTLLRWNGRAGRVNSIKVAPSDYVKPGTYKVRLRIVASSGATSRTYRVTVRANKSPIVSVRSCPSVMSPLVPAGARACVIKYSITQKNDVFLSVRRASDNKQIALKKYRDVSANTAHLLTWDGHITQAGSIKMPSGKLAVAGDITPPGKYYFLIVSRGVKYKSAVTVKPVQPTSVSASAPKSSLLYGTSETLRATVYPQGYVSQNVVWSVSNPTLATVSQAGVLTAKTGQEGNVVVTARCAANQELLSTATVFITSSSTMQANGIAVSKWCLYNAPKTLLGKVISNTPIAKVRFSIYNEAGDVELTKLVSAGDIRYSKASTTFDVKKSMDSYVQFRLLTAGKKTLKVYATDEVVTRRVYAQTFWVLGPTRNADFWEKRKSIWVYPLDVKNTSNISYFGSVRDNGARAHAAIDLIEPAGLPVYAMTDGTVERVCTAYYEGTQSVQVKNTDGTVLHYCEVRPAKGIVAGKKVKQNQIIAYIEKNNYGTSMLHLEAYLGNVTGRVTQSNSSTYDNVTAVTYNRRRDLIYPMGVLDLSVPTERVVAP